MKKRISLFFVIYFIFGSAQLPSPVLGQSNAGEQNLIPNNNGPAGPAAKADKFPRTDELVTVDFTEADIQTVLDMLADKANVNIVVSPEVKGTVSMHLKNVPWQSAFETILRTYGYTYEQDGNIYEVYSLETSQKRLSQKIGPEVVRSDVITLEYATLDQVKKGLEKVLSGVGKIESIPGTNQIVLTDTPSQLKNARNLIASIDRKMPQVHIDARIVQTALAKGESLGIDWNIVASASGAKRPTTFPFSVDARRRSPDKNVSNTDFMPQGQTQVLNTTTTTATGATSTAQNVDFPFREGFPFAQKEDFAFGTIDFSQFSAIFSMLQKRKSTKVISNPRIVVLNHQSARVQVGGEVGIPRFERNETTGSLEVAGFDPRNFGIVLNVSPHVTNEKEIIMDIQPEVTNFIGFIPIGGTNLASPQFETLVAKTSVLVHSGDTLVIGGLIGDNEEDNHSKVPYLNRIPVLGWFFKGLRREPDNNKRTETIFFVTVTLADDVYNQKALKQWRQNQKEYEDFRKYSEEKFFSEGEEKKQEAPVQKAETPDAAAATVVA